MMLKLNSITPSTKYGKNYNFIAPFQICHNRLPEIKAKSSYLMLRKGHEVRAYKCKGLMDDAILKWIQINIFQLHNLKVIDRVIFYSLNNKDYLEVSVKQSPTSLALTTLEFTSYNKMERVLANMNIEAKVSADIDLLQEKLISIFEEMNGRYI